jgi:hypothetical protein
MEPERAVAADAVAAAASSLAEMMIKLANRKYGGFYDQKNQTGFPEARQRPPGD